MDIEQEARWYANGLKLPSDELQFSEYHDDARQSDVVQVYVRDNHPPKHKYAFEIEVPRKSNWHNIKQKLHKNLESLEESYLENGSHNVTFYKGQGFFWTELFKHGTTDDVRDVDDSNMNIPDGDTKYLRIECTSCGWELQSPYMDSDIFNKYRDIILMWLLARGRGRCDCDQFEPVNEYKDRHYDLDPDELVVEEGSMLPRANRKI